MSEETNDGWDETTEEKAIRIYLSAIMEQLLERDRFKTFLECNYDVTTGVNEETQSLEITVMELDPSIAQQRLERKLEDHAKDKESSIITDSKVIESTLKTVRKDKGS